ncbi:MAG: hypothetical protein AB8A46_09005 [Prochlorococcus sp.]|nr:DUF1330 domain-containing protein [Gammaproteobacteria bacterium]
MLYITQLIYIHKGQEEAFNEFEAHAIPIIANYHGELIFRLRPEASAFIETGSMDKPYEIHLISFPTEADFGDFMADQERKKFLHLKEQSIKVLFLVKGEKL